MDSLLREYTDRVYSRSEDSVTRAPERRAPADAVLIFEGVLHLRDELAAAWDFSIFLVVRGEAVLARGLERDTHGGGAIPSTCATRAAIFPVSACTSSDIAGRRERPS